MDPVICPPIGLSQVISERVQEKESAALAPATNLSSIIAKTWQLFSIPVEFATYTISLGKIPCQKVIGIASTFFHSDLSDKETVQKSLAGIQINAKKREVTSQKYTTAVMMPEAFYEDALRTHYTLKKENEERQVLSQHVEIPPGSEGVEIRNALVQELAKTYIDVVGEKAFQNLALIINQAITASLVEGIRKLKVNGKELEAFAFPGNQGALEYHTTVLGNQIHIDLKCDFNLLACCPVTYQGKSYQPGEVLGFISVKKEMKMSLKDLNTDWKNVPLKWVAPSLQVKDIYSVIKPSLEAARNSIGAA